MSNIIDVTFLSRLVELSGPPGRWSMSRPELLFERFSLSFRIQQSLRLRSASFRVLTVGLPTFYMRRNQSRKGIAAVQPARPRGADRRGTQDEPHTKRGQAHPLHNSVLKIIHMS